MQSEEARMIAELRVAAFGTARNQIDDGSVGCQASVYGVIIEEGFDDGAYSFLAFCEGSVSLYYKEGGGQIGIGGDQALEPYVEPILNASQLANPVELKEVLKNPPDWPGDGTVNIYYLTDDGVLQRSTTIDDLVASDASDDPVFARMHDLLTAMKENGDFD